MTGSFKSEPSKQEALSAFRSVQTFKPKAAHGLADLAVGSSLMDRMYIYISST
jgi:hypothetical protein